MDALRLALWEPAERQARSRPPKMPTPSRQYEAYALPSGHTFPFSSGVIGSILSKMLTFSYPDDLGKKTKKNKVFIAGRITMVM